MKSSIVAKLPRQRAEFILIGNRRGIAEQRLHFFVALVQRFQFFQDRVNSRL
jgi:hypothetical protein